MMEMMMKGKTMNHAMNKNKAKNKNKKAVIAITRHDATQHADTEASTHGSTDNDDCVSVDGIVNEEPFHFQTPTSSFHTLARSLPLSSSSSTPSSSAGDLDSQSQLNLSSTFARIHLSLSPSPSPSPSSTPSVLSDASPSSLLSSPLVAQSSSHTSSHLSRSIPVTRGVVVGGEMMQASSPLPLPKSSRDLNRRSSSSSSLSSPLSRPSSSPPLAPASSTGLASPSPSTDRYFRFSIADEQEAEASPSSSLSLSSDTSTLTERRGTFNDGFGLDFHAQKQNKHAFDLALYHRQHLSQHQHQHQHPKPHDQAHSWFDEPASLSSASQLKPQPHEQHPAFVSRQYNAYAYSSQRQHRDKEQTQEQGQGQEQEHGKGPTHQITSEEMKYDWEADADARARLHMLRSSKAYIPPPPTISAEDLSVAIDNVSSGGGKDRHTSSASASQLDALNAALANISAELNFVSNNAM